MNERIKELRLSLNLTQEAFGKRLGIARNTVANYETSKRTPSNQIILAIVREFNVNEEWLTNGTGEMFIQTESTVISELAKEFNATDLEIKLLKSYFAIDKDVRSIFMSRLINNLLGDEEIAQEISLEKEVNSYRNELVAQKKDTEKSSVSHITNDA